MGGVVAELFCMCHQDVGAAARWGATRWPVRLL